MLKRVASLVVALSLALPPTAPAGAQGRSPGLIRDAEVERIIRAYATPLFQAAALATRCVSDGCDVSVIDV